MWNTSAGKWAIYVENIRVMRDSLGRVLKGSPPINPNGRRATKAKRVQERFLVRFHELIEEAGSIEKLAERARDCLTEPKLDRDLRSIVLPMVVPLIGFDALDADDSGPEGASPEVLARLAEEFGAESAGYTTPPEARAPLLLPAQAGR